MGNAVWDGTHAVHQTHAISLRPRRADPGIFGDKTRCPMINPIIRKALKPSLGKLSKRETRKMRCALRKPPAMQRMPSAR